MTAVLVALVIAVGLPALAWWLGGRAFWSRLRLGAGPDPWGDAMRRHGLSPAETAVVEAAVNWGRRVDEAHLRPATVAWAHAVLEQRTARPRPRGFWVGVLVLAVVILALVAVIVVDLQRGEDFPWVLVIVWFAGGLASSWTATAPRRAIRLNSAD